MTDTDKAGTEPRVVLTYSNFVVPDDSALLKDEAWLSEVLSHKDEDGDYMLRLMVHPSLEGQAALDYIRNRTSPTTDKAGMLADELEKRNASLGPNRLVPIRRDELAAILVALRSPPYEAGVRRDAERYRWLRDGLSKNLINAYAITETAWKQTPDCLDAAIDALLDSGPGEEQKRG